MRRHKDAACHLGFTACTLQTSRDVQLESAMRTKVDVRQRLWIFEFTP